MNKLTKKDLKLRKKETQELAQKLAAKIDKTEMVLAVAAETNMTADDALQLIITNGLDKKIHNLVTDSITEGALAVRAIDSVRELMASDDDRIKLEAAKLVLSFNNNLAPQTTRMVENLHFHKHQNLFADLDKQAKELLGE